MRRITSTEGITDSLVGWSRRLGISPQALYERIERWGEQEAISHNKISNAEAVARGGRAGRGRGKKYRIDGRDWTVEEIAESTGLKPGSVRVRLSKGWRGKKLLMPRGGKQ